MTIDQLIAKMPQDFTVLVPGSSHRLLLKKKRVVVEKGELVVEYTTAVPGHGNQIASCILTPAAALDAGVTTLLRMLSSGVMHDAQELLRLPLT